MSKIIFFVKIKFIIEKVLDKKTKKYYYKIEMYTFRQKN